MVEACLTYSRLTDALHLLWINSVIPPIPCSVGTLCFSQLSGPPAADQQEHSCNWASWVYYSLSVGRENVQGGGVSARVFLRIYRIWAYVRWFGGWLRKRGFALDSILLECGWFFGYLKSYLRGLTWNETKAIPAEEVLIAVTHIRQERGMFGIL